VNPSFRRKSTSQGGYIGLLSLLLAVLVIGLWFAFTYGRQSAPAPGKETGLEGDPRGAGSIQKAEDVKVLIEEQNKAATEPSY